MFSSRLCRCIGAHRAHVRYVRHYYRDQEETADGQQQALGRHLGHLAGAE